MSNLAVVYFFTIPFANLRGNVTRTFLGKSDFYWPVMVLAEQWQCSMYANVLSVLGSVPTMFLQFLGLRRDGSRLFRQTQIIVREHRERKLNTTFFSQTFRAPPGYSGKNPGISCQKVWFPWVSKDIPNFLAPTRSRGRLPPDRRYPDPKFGFVLLFLT